MKRECIVVDANILIEGFDIFSLLDRYDVLMPPEVEKEVRRKGDPRTLEMAKSGGLRICSPAEKYLKKVDEKAKITGDEGRLSPADRTLLALALHESGILLTDDYSVQNVAHTLNVKVMKGLQRGIEKIYTWRSVCTGCGRTFDNPPEGEVCPVCGSELKKVKVEGSYFPDEQ